MCPMGICNEVVYISLAYGKFNKMLFSDLGRETFQVISENGPDKKTAIGGRRGMNGRFRWVNGEDGPGGRVERLKGRGLAH